MPQLITLFLSKTTVILGLMFGALALHAITHTYYLLALLIWIPVWVCIDTLYVSIFHHRKATHKLDTLEPLLQGLITATKKTSRFRPISTTS